MGLRVTDLPGGRVRVEPAWRSAAPDADAHLKEHPSFCALLAARLKRGTP
jgi:hypothetical protein